MPVDCCVAERLCSPWKASFFSLVLETSIFVGKKLNETLTMPVLFTRVAAIRSTLPFLLGSSVVLKPSASQTQANLEGLSELYTKGTCS